MYSNHIEIVEDTIISINRMHATVRNVVDMQVLVCDMSKVDDDVTNEGKLWISWCFMLVFSNAMP